VIAAEEAGVPVGAVVRHRAGWREHAVVDAATVTVVDADAAPVGAWLGVIGQTGFTAWVGLKRIGALSDGDTVFISAAAGAVGSAAGRFAKLLGAGRVLGSAGGPDKVRQLVEQLGFDDAMDYRAESPKDAVRRLAPDGIDVYFDNVGGPHLVAALKSMNVGGRVALCGMISQYSDDGRGEDINNLIEAVLRRVTIRGFIVRDHEDMRAEFEQTVAAWLRSGDVEVLQTVTDGIDHAVEGFLGMLKGANVGKALVRLDPDWEI
jgi:NADPH-dependent curcumin reductase CurA